MSRSRRRARARRRHHAAAGVATAALLALPVAAHAETFTVSTTADSGPGSLRAALQLVTEDPETADVVTFDAAVTGTIALSSDVNSRGPVSIVGPGADVLTVRAAPGFVGIGLQGDPADPVPVSVSGITLAGGAIGLAPFGTDLTVTDTVIRDARGIGLAADNGNAGSLVVDGVTFADNRLALNSQGPTTVIDSTFTGSLDGALRVFATDAGEDVVVRGSTFTGNASSQAGGAIRAVLAADGMAEVDGVTATTNTSQGAGGAVSVEGGTTMVTDSTFTGNRGGSGGALSVVSEEPQALTLRDATFTGNQGGTGGAVAVVLGAAATAALDAITASENTASGTGGAVNVNGGTAVISDSTLRANRATVGGALSARVLEPQGLVLRDSTLSANTVSGSAGGAYLAVEDDASAALDQVTVVGNRAEQASGGVTAARYVVRDTRAAGPGTRAVDPEARVTLRASTVADNVALSPGAVVADGVPVALRSTVVAGSTAFGPSADLAVVRNGSFSAEASFVQFPSDAVPAQGVTTGDPGLGPLRDNGGPTQTKAPFAGSPLLDAGQAFTDLTQDQRGLPRTVDLAGLGPAGGDGTDIGAVEAQTAPVAPPTGSTVTTTTPPPSPEVVTQTTTTVVPAPPAPPAPAAPARPSATTTQAAATAPPPIAGRLLFGSRSRKPGATATVRLTVLTGGRLEAKGSGVRSVSKVVGKGGAKFLRLRLTSAAARTLASKGRFTARVTFTFTPTGGTAASALRTVTYSTAATATKGGSR